MTEPLHPTHPAPQGPGPTASRSRTMPLVLGVVLALVGLPLLLAGVGLGWALGTQRDDDGFFAAPTERFTTSTVALTSAQIAFGEIGPADWWAERNLATLRLSARSTGSEVFVGIAPSSDVERYLGSAGYDQISDITDNPFHATITRHGDDGHLDGPPTEQRFWTAQASGTGTQSLTWDLAPGTYTAVVMNVDGSPGLTVDLTAAGRVDLLVPLAWTLGVVGTLLIVGGALLVVHGARPPASRDRRPAGPDARTTTDRALVAGAGGDPPSSPVTVTGHQDARLSRWLWLVKWVLVIPHFLILALLWLVFVALTVVAFFAILFTGRYPRGLFDLNVGILRWTWRVQFYATNAIGTDRYPPFTLDHADYPADLDVEYPERLSRGLVLVKSWLLAIPHLIVLGIIAGTWRFGDQNEGGFTVGGLIGALTLAAGLILLFAGRYPAPLFDFLMGLNRWVYRVVAYIALMTDAYPPFRLDQGPTEFGPPRTPDPPPGPSIIPEQPTGERTTSGHEERVHR
ncbi:DUF4389 domain-containing protein [Plantactinospora sp. WMMB334]|uniref:DUF4389 domain-containing protein n=1 Tax=Plantactinospora sp. WMMB334 TaxID=3404119 RepID=UPI003B967412